VPITIKAGAGVDQVHGGAGGEFIFGGDGNDSLWGGGGTDYMQGDNGNDAIEGEAGHDYIYGDLGNDTLKGGDGNDVMAGDLENILVRKGEAPRGGPTDLLNDSLDGGAGNDWLLSERRLIGVVQGNPNTTADDKPVFADNGRDTFVGGEGNDIIDIGANQFDSTFNDDTIVGEETGDFVPLKRLVRGTHEPGNVHQHMKLKIKVHNGRKYTNVKVPANLGMFSFGPSMNDILSYLHTHDFDTKNGTRIHFEPVSPSTYQLREFFHAAGISISSGHVGRSLPPAGKKVTLFVTRNGQTKRNKLLDRFRPNGGPGTADGDVMELRVG
jgi:Ca2+-binding RTX toxin-like protein